VCSSDLYRELAGQGILKELDVEQIKQYAPTMYATMMSLFEGLTPNVFDLIRLDGKLYGFPIGNLNGTYATIPIWRDDWLSKAGFSEPPTSWNDCVTAWTYFAKEDPDGDGNDNTFAFSNTGMNYIRNSAFGGDAFDMFFEDDSGNLVPNVLTGNYNEYVTTMAEFYSQGLIDPEFITGENQGQYWALSVTFNNGLIGFACPGAYYHTNPPLYEGQKNPSTNWQPFYDLNPDGSYTHGKSLTGPTGLNFTPRGVATPGGKVVIGKNISDAAYIRFLQFHEAMFSDYDVYRLVVDGINGVSYEDVELPDGRIAYQVFTDDELKAAGRPNARKGVYTNGFGFLAEDCWDFLKKRDIALYDYADAVATIEALGGTPYRNKVWIGMTKTARNKTDMDTLRDQNFQLFVTGQRPVSDWDNYINELKGAGMQEWIDECNEWNRNQ
jgi:putative aldouronate transport system substrate-binding protein